MERRKIRFDKREKVTGLYYYYPYWVDTKEPVKDEMGEEVECQGEEEKDAFIELLRLRPDEIEIK